MRLLSFIYQRSNFTPTTNHLVNLSFFISNISARFRLILAVYHQTSLKMSHPSGGPCGGKSHPIMPHISCIIPNNYNAGYINPYDVSWDFNGISNLQRSPPTTIRFLAGLLSANNHVKKKKKSQPSKSWGPPGGLAPLAPLPRLQLVFHKLHDPADQLKGGILAVQVLPDLIALLALGFLGCRMLQATPYSSGLLGFIILLV